MKKYREPRQAPNFGKKPKNKKKPTKRHIQDKINSLIKDLMCWEHWSKSSCLSTLTADLIKHTQKRLDKLKEQLKNET